MDTVTYPTPEVDHLLGGKFVCYSVNTKELTRDGRELLHRYRLLWEPGLVFLEPRGAEIRRVVGYLPPVEFLAQLRIVLGLVHLLYRREADALDELRRVALEADAAPEALYWAGIAAYRLAGRDVAVLKREWQALGDRYPRSRWSRSADVFDVVPSGVRQMESR